MKKVLELEKLKEKTIKECVVNKHKNYRKDFFGIIFPSIPSFAETSIKSCGECGNISEYTIIKEEEYFKSPCKHQKKDRSEEAKKEIERKKILEYFKKENIKSIKLEGDKVIEYYNNGNQETKEIKDNLELEKIKSFAEKLGKTELTLKDLEKGFISSSENKGNTGLYIVLAILGVIFVIVIIGWLVMRNKGNKKKNVS